MTTPLNKPIARLTAKRVGSRQVIVTLSPAGSQSEALIGLRLKGTRAEYTVRLSDVYRMAALWHGQAEARARRDARRAGIPWRVAKKQFEASRKL